MNQNTLAIGAASIWMIAKMIAFQKGMSSEAFNMLVMLHMFLLMLVIIGSVYLHYRSENAQHSSFGNDLKVALQGAGKYLLLFIGILAVYYIYVDPDMLTDRGNEAIQLATDQIEDDNTWKKLQENDARLREVSKEDYLQNVEESSAMINSPKTFLALSTMASVMYAIICCIVVVVFFRYLLFKGQDIGNTPQDPSLN